MPTVLQFRRGTTAQNNAFTGSAGEVSIDTDLDTFRIHDGSTAGGFGVAKDSNFDGSATQVFATANNTTAETVYLTFVDGATGAQGIETDTGLTWNPGTNVLTAANITGLASSAKYADLAERYTADSDYDPGTVLIFDGALEVTVSNQDASPKVAGVVSTDPAYLMNSDLQGTLTVALALTGRVPTKVVGPVHKGDMMVSTADGRARAESNPAMGTVIGKALEDFSGTEGTIEVVVGRL